jgi:outer membrane autotransporter protein
VVEKCDGGHKKFNKKKGSFQMIKLITRLLALALFVFALPATAGHLFTQASTNTPITLTAGQGILIPQNAFEGSSSNAGLVTLDFLNSTDAWDAGDIIRVSFAGYTQDFSFDAPLAGTNQGDTFMNATDPVLTGLALDLTAPVQLTVQSVAGGFTFAGYRIYTGNETLDGTNAGLVNQANVIIIGNNIHTNWGYTVASTHTITGSLDSVQSRINSVRNGEFIASNSHQSTGMSSGDGMSNKNMWLKVFGGKTDQDMDDGFAGYDSDTYGMSAGIDKELSNHWNVGAAFTYAKTDVDMNDFRSGDDSEIDTYQLTLYGHKNFKNWYLESMLAYAYQDYTTNRFTGAGTAKADFNGDSVALRVVAGKPITVKEKYKFSPYAGVELIHISQDSYTEKGAGALLLNVSSLSEDLVRGLLGVEVSRNIQRDSGLKMRPSLRVGVRHEFNDSSIDATTALIGGTGSVTTKGPAFNQNTYTVDAGLDIQKSDNMTISLSLGGEKSSDYYGYNGQVVARWRF